jgi:hypothetical protein
LCHLCSLYAYRILGDNPRSTLRIRKKPYLSRAAAGRKKGIAGLDLVFQDVPLAIRAMRLARAASRRPSKSAANT